MMCLKTGVVIGASVLLPAAMANAAVVVSDHGLTAPTLGVNDAGYTGAGNARFSWDPGDVVGQTFTLDSAITLGSIWIAYNDFEDGSGTFTLSVDAGNNGSSEITESGVVLNNADFSGASTDVNEVYWMQWDLSSHNLTLGAGIHSFRFDMTAEDGGTKGWALASVYNNGDVYAGGSEQGLPNSGDFLFAVTAVPEPSSLALVGLGTLLVVRRRRRH